MIILCTQGAHSIREAPRPSQALPAGTPGGRGVASGFQWQRARPGRRPRSPNESGPSEGPWLSPRFSPDLPLPELSEPAASGSRPGNILRVARRPPSLGSPATRPERPLTHVDRSAETPSAPRPGFASRWREREVSSGSHALAGSGCWGGPRASAAELRAEGSGVRPSLHDTAWPFGCSGTGRRLDPERRGRWGARGPPGEPTTPHVGSSGPVASYSCRRHRQSTLGRRRPRRAAERRRRWPTAMLTRTGPGGVGESPSGGGRAPRLKTRRVSQR